jgi:hypothetical protein
MTRNAVRGAVGGLVLALVACSGLFPTSISTIKNDPRTWDGKVVTVRGTVKSSFSAFGLKYYEVDDGTGTMPVVTKGAVPKEGASVRVTGRVDQAFALGDKSLVVLVEERTSR